MDAWINRVLSICVEHISTVVSTRGSVKLSSGSFCQPYSFIGPMLAEYSEDRIKFCSAHCDSGSRSGGSQRLAHVLSEVSESAAYFVAGALIAFDCEQAIARPNDHSGNECVYLADRNQLALLTRQV